jgi:hypothetical protein
MNELITADGEVIESTSLSNIDTSAISATTRAEFDTQIVTAKRFPRQISKCSNNILSLVTLTKSAAEECMFALPRGGKPIVGPSIRLAEIVFGQWGNSRVSARIVDVNRAEKYVEAEAIFMDMESNVAIRTTHRRRISGKDGKIFSDDMILVTGNAACSIARRNAILQGVPKAVWSQAYEAAESTVKGDVKTLGERRDGMFKAFAAFGVKPEQIFASLGVAGQDDITLEHIPVLTGMYQALKSGEETVERMFARDGGAPASSGLADKLKGKSPEAGGFQEAHIQSQSQKVEQKPPTQPEPALAETGPQEAQGETVYSAARERGRKDRSNGVQKRAVPPEYRGDEMLVDAWFAGWDEGAAA